LRVSRQLPTTASKSGSAESCSSMCRTRWRSAPALRPAGNAGASPRMRVASCRLCLPVLARGVAWRSKSSAIWGTATVALTRPGGRLVARVRRT
jgi:hypothetical protein